MSVDQQIIAPDMNDVHQQGHRHRLFREAVGPDGCGQRIQQRLKEDSAADNMHI
ncbi:hypothetical protein D3C80_2213800 [compost metagenome]